MKIKIHVELITDWKETITVEASEFARAMSEFTTETVGLSLTDGQKLLQAVQQHVVAIVPNPNGLLQRCCMPHASCFGVGPDR